MTNNKEVFPIRQDIEVLGPDDPKKTLLGWRVYEPSDKEWEEIWAERFSKERQEATDIANKYKVYHHAEFDKKDYDVHCFCSIKVLEFLYGKPWNNMAANYLMCLRPSYVRVIPFNGGQTLDSCSWRVTVVLNEDNTIKQITQEVIAGTIGVVNGTHIAAYAEGRSMQEKYSPYVFINPRCLEKIKNIEINNEELEKKI